MLRAVLRQYTNRYLTDEVRPEYLSDKYNEYVAQGYILVGVEQWR